MTSQSDKPPEKIMSRSDFNNLAYGAVTTAEKEWTRDWCALVQRVCVAQYSSNPLWKARAESDPEFWNRHSFGRATLYESEILRLPLDEAEKQELLTEFRRLSPNFRPR